MLNFGSVYLKKGQEVGGSNFPQNVFFCFGGIQHFGVLKAPKDFVEVRLRQRDEDSEGS